MDQETWNELMRYHRRCVLIEALLREEDDPQITSQLVAIRQHADNQFAPFRDKIDTRWIEGPPAAERIDRMREALL